MNESESKPEHAPVPVYIDRVHYDAPSHKVAGQMLRDMPNPKVADDRDLWLEVEGPKDDELIHPEKHYEIKTWAHFYTSPKTINPGGA